MTANCPKCLRPLEPSGDIDGEPLYACDHCTVVKELLGTAERMALVFLLDAGKRPIDPVSREPIDVKLITTHE